MLWVPWASSNVVNGVRRVEDITEALCHSRAGRSRGRATEEQVAAKLKEMKLADAAALVVAGIEETLYYYVFRASTGGVCGQTIRWNASCVKYDEGHAPWERFRMGSPR
jgi:hypothetical protein